MSYIAGYPSIYALGHRVLADLLLDPVVIQEKIDGSQISFGVYWESEEPPVFRIRSKGAELNLDAPEKMFAAAVRAIRDVEMVLVPGWTYRGEYLAKPKHNVLAYDRTPAHGIILFDIDRGDQDYADPAMLEIEARRLGFESVPTLYSGTISEVAGLRVLLDTVSCLGGQKIEGVVIKNYARYGPDKKVLMGKFVSEAYKEVHAAEWKMSNPNAGDVVQRLIDRYRTPARWAKAGQHLRDGGFLDNEPKDIGLLFKEVPADLLREEEEAIKAALLAWAWPKVQRGVTAGLAEWYKEELLKRQFEGASK